MCCVDRWRPCHAEVQLVCYWVWLLNDNFKSTADQVKALSMPTRMTTGWLLYIHFTSAVNNCPANQSSKLSHEAAVPNRAVDVSVEITGQDQSSTLNKSYCNYCWDAALLYRSLQQHEKVALTEQHQKSISYTESLIRVMKLQESWAVLSTLSTNSWINSAASRSYIAWHVMCIRSHNLDNADQDHTAMQLQACSKLLWLQCSTRELLRPQHLQGNTATIETPTWSWLQKVLLLGL